tara:strand:- start:198 stop:632 length:435 start_codon:yes stop_codon:yes gene_type:complete
MHKILELYNKLNKFGADHNMEMTIIEPGHIVYKMEVQDKHMATPNAIHGGMIAAMMDGVLGVAALSASAEDDKLVSTVEFKINYLNPARLGDQLVGEGSVDRKGKRIIITSGQIVAANRNVVIAKAMGTFNAYPPEKAGVNPNG